MKVSRLVKGSLKTAVAFLVFHTTSSHAANLPDYQRLFRAQQRAHALVLETNRLAAIASGQPQGQSCRSLSYQFCVQRQDCEWKTIDASERGICIERYSGGGRFTEVDENDHLAFLALQTLSISMQGMAHWIDLLVANYNSAASFQYHFSACQSVRENLLGTVGARAAAALPMQGAITPHEMDPIRDELLYTKQDLNCLL